MPTAAFDRKRSQEHLREPRKNLCAAVLCQAIRDLSSKDVFLRKDAIIFLLGPLAKQYLQYLDTEDDVLIRAVAIYSKPDEIDRFTGARPDNAITTIAPAVPPNDDEGLEQQLDLLLRRAAPDQRQQKEGATR